ncbi:MAG: hypothetical protein F6K09_08405 [Merismopedia sp. SIO2A8]|nr:hypothetical protein [Merismopedia sp. SIO2A8]
MVLVLGISLGALLTSGILSWLQFRSAFQTQVFERLNSIRAAKGKQLEFYLETLSGHIATLSDDRMVVSAMVELNAAYRQLNNEAIADNWLTDLEQYYTDDFLPDLAENTQSTQLASNYRPTTQAGQYLQYQYIANNVSATAVNTDDAGDGSDYSRIHARYHPHFRHLTLEFGYTDLYLINFTTGDIVYSTRKSVDYATSIDRGPYRRSNLADVVAAVRNDPGPGFVQVEDYRPYIPNYAAPTAFYAAPIYNGPHIVGILAAQLPTDRIQSVLTGHQEWEQDGLGETGQVYVVGADVLMRSSDRTLLEEPDTYHNRLKRLGLAPQTLHLAQALNTSILLHPVDTTATEAALAGTIDTEIITDYRGVPVLSSYAPLRLQGLRWAILAEIDQTEAFGPVNTLQIYMSILGVILILLITWFSNFAAQSFAQPIQILLDVADRIRQGERDVEIEIGSDLKSDQLEESLQGVLQDLHAQEILTAAKEAINETLRQNLMPKAMAKRLQQEPLPIADSLQQITIVVVRLSGLQDMIRTAAPGAIAESMHHIIQIFDEKAKTYGLETQLTIDNTYLATCGNSQLVLDHQERAVNFALDLVRTVEADTTEFPSTLDLQIGIHSGSAIAGVICTGNQDRKATHSKSVNNQVVNSQSVNSKPIYNHPADVKTDSKLMYKLWGDTITIAMELNLQGGASNSILVTQPIRDRLQDQYLLVPTPFLHVKDIGAIGRWMVFTPTHQFEYHVDLLQTCLAQLLPQAPVTTKHFYTYLLDREPELAGILLGPQCKQDILDQIDHYQTSLFQLLQTVVTGLGTIDKLLPTVQRWGQEYTQHYGQPLEHQHYEALYNALIWAFDKTPGVDLSLEVTQAWHTGYLFLRGVMEEATMGTIK